MSDPSVDLFTAAVANLAATFSEGLAPVYEAGMGLRSQLEQAGWSPAMAEQLAAHAVMQNIDMLYTKMKKDLT